MKRIIQFVIGAALIMGVAGCASNKTYNIKFVNDDQTLLQEVTVKHGEVPEYTGQTPTKEASAEFTYTFKDWTPQIVAAHADATYTATYESAKRKYTITFNNDDGTLISSSLVEHGTMPTPPEDPTKESSARYDYAFSGWDKEIVAVTEDATYTATYNRTVRNFLITFLDEDETTVLKSERFDYGVTPTCDEPTKEPTVSITYAFAGWSPEVVPVVSDATYVATYSESTRKYTVTFLDDDGETVLKSSEVEYGTLPTCDDPKKESTETQSFIFKGWSPEVVEVVGDATYTATYEATVRLYEIKFVDDEGNVMDIQNLEYGTYPDLPSTNKESTEEFAYYFEGWDKAIETATEDTTYTATYKKVRIGYNFDSENTETFIGAGVFDLDEEEDKQDETWIMTKDRGGTLNGTAEKYLQYQFYRDHTYKFTLPKIDFRYLKSLSSGISILDWDSSHDTSIAFTKEEAENKAGLVINTSYQQGRIEIATTTINTIEVKINVKPDNTSQRISKTIVDEDVYIGEKSIELFVKNAGGDKYFLINEFAPRMDLQYQINKDRVIAVNNTYSWAACYLQMVIGQTFLPIGSYVHSSPEVIKLYRNNELVTTAISKEDIEAAGLNPYDAYPSKDGMHFSFGSGGDGVSQNWMARTLSNSFNVADVIQNGDVLVLDGVFVGKPGTITEGFEINFDLSFRITTVENGYQSSKTGYKFTML